MKIMLKMTCLGTEDAIDDRYIYIGSDGRKRHVQSTKKLTVRVFRIAGKLRPDDVDVGRTLTQDGQQTENQPNSVERDVDRRTRQPIAEGECARVGAATARHVAGKRPVRPRHAHAQ